MSIYATIGSLMVPTGGYRKRCDGYLHADEYGEEFLEVTLQGVPGHIGHPNSYEDGDPYGDFLPPPVENENDLRAVVVVAPWTTKGTRTNGQQYIQPLLVLDGPTYEAISLRELLERIEQAVDAARQFPVKRQRATKERAMIEIPHDVLEELMDATEDVAGAEDPAEPLYSARLIVRIALAHVDGRPCGLVAPVCQRERCQPARAAMEERAP